MYDIVFSKRASKDKALLKSAKLDNKAKYILKCMQGNPFIVPPPYEALVGNLQGKYSRRINIQHRIVYSVDNTATESFDGIILIHRMWSHYE